ncbi:hypothetical protein Daus18300_011705 [Diaporthe australafricana]|uniref:Uncharacterized protein n=1 Tax=Diaporthe australafricana TaxID=127596 RepID=A0ABR3W5X6_9PEZI
MQPQKKNFLVNTLSTQDSTDVSPQMRSSPASFHPQAAQAAVFVPGDQKSEINPSDKEETPAKKIETPTKAEEEVDEKTQKAKAMEEEWWTGDDVFAPNLK